MHRIPTRGHSALRRGRVSTDGGVYLVTFATFQRAPLFGTFDLAAPACRAMTDPSLWQSSRLLAWVLMPDHWHGVLQLHDGERLPDLVRRLKCNSARAVRGCAGASLRVWARAYHDRAIRCSESAMAAARYVLDNPVRAGLVASRGRYPYWDAVWVEGVC